MTDSAIFLFNDGVLTPLEETPYANEALLQQALADYPNLIAGAGTGGAAGQLLLIRREMPVTDSTGANSMSLDHLFVDGDGVPVLVEVKRSSDTRSRREVVAQMLDYAANGSVYWPVDRLRAYVDDAEGGPDRLTELLGVDGDPEMFWRTVEDNLRAGRLRLVFLADRLQPELIRIIEFLNEQMRDTEVLGVELPQFRGTDSSSVIYVPRIVGRTAVAAETKRGATGGTTWNRATLMTAAREQAAPDQVRVIESLLRDVDAHQGRFSWGSGGTAGVTGWYPVDGIDTPVWNINLSESAGRANLYFIFREYASRHPDARVDAFAASVSGIGGLGASVEAARGKAWRSWVPIRLSDAAHDLDQVLASVRAATASRPDLR